MDRVVGVLPPEAAAVARDSIGGTIGVANRIGDAAAPLIAAANEAFVNAMSSVVWVAAGVALMGAAVTAMYLSAEALHHTDERAMYDYTRVEAATTEES
ncbi:MAG: hypothetical protein M5U23_04380 [Acidimicrobiia bacterium]|nr:hypothetical protein [Acidimicrobiia bacterium]